MAEIIRSLSQQPSLNVQRLWAGATNGVEISIDWDKGGPDPEDPKKNLPMGLHVHKGHKGWFINIAQLLAE